LILKGFFEALAAGFTLVGSRTAPKDGKAATGTY
jgi:hypothetical protein